MVKIIAAAIGAATLVGASGAYAQDRISAVYAFPRNIVYAQSFLKFVDKVNKAGQGVVQIQVRGGPEVIGQFEQGDAVRRGVVDMAYLPVSFYAATVPEGDALVSSNVTPMEVRRNGGLDLMKQAHAKKLNAYYLGWIDGGVQFHIYTTRPPKIGANGKLELAGFKLRGNPIYNAFFTEYLGASIASIPSTELYTALERNTIDASGWTSIGIMDLKWDNFLKYRVDPGFFQTDLGVIVNMDSWNKLSPTSKDLLTKSIIEYEQESYIAMQKQVVDEEKEMLRRGLKIVKLDGAPAKEYVRSATEKTWDRMKDRLTKQGDGALFDQLVAKFYKAN
ncbi:MAG: TRAP transporter substrate-binding protein DctP [Proteobacteria bacterium]|nr:TRAP transporter substrate-binding protein DctP [Pseudomonadota bacterium]